MEGAKCPYCEAAYEEEDGRCAQCKALFPWAIEAKAIREDIKSREVNRGRATFTLIDELFAQAKGGKPVSLAALKGFAFAWLFPRTMIVIGSIISGLVLIAQTAIIYRQNELIEGQNELMQKQTAAMQLEQAEKLRARIASNAALSARLSELSLVRFTRFEDRNVDWASQLHPDYILPFLEGKIEPKHVERGSVGETLLAISAASAAYEEAKAPSGLDAMTALQQAELRCAFDSAQLKDVRAALSAIKGISIFDSGTFNKVIASLIFIRFRDISRYKETDPIKTLIPDDSLLKKKLVMINGELSAAFQLAADKCNERIVLDSTEILNLERKASATSPATASAPSAASR